MRILKYLLTGLGNDSYRYAGGMRSIADAFDLEAIAQGYIVQNCRHDWAENPPDAVCHAMLAEALAFKPQYVVVQCHSFGAALFLFFAQWLVQWHPRELVIDRAVIFDLAVNALQFGAAEWIDVDAAYADNTCRPQLPHTSVKHALEFFRRAGRPLGVRGCPVFLRDGITLLDVTDRRRVHVQTPALDTFEDWQQGPPLDHSTMISHPRTQAIAKQYLMDGLMKNAATAPCAPCVQLCHAASGESAGVSRAAAARSGFTLK